MRSTHIRWLGLVGILFAAAAAVAAPPTIVAPDASGTLRATTGFTTNRDVAITANDGALSVAAGQTLTISGVFTGAAGSDLAKVGTGILSVTGNSSAYAGNTTVNGGTLAVNNAAGTFGTDGAPCAPARAEMRSPGRKTSMRPGPKLWPETATSPCRT